MTRTVTETAVKRIITKGLTGWEAGKLTLQDLIDSYHRRESVLTEADFETIRNTPMQGADVRDYNTFMALCRGFYMGYIDVANGRIGNGSAAATEGVQNP